MYVMYEFEEWIGIPPEKVYNTDDINAVALQILRDRLESTFDYELGIIIAVMDVEVEGEGYIIPMPNDPNAYFLARYKVLAFDAFENEVVKGVVRDVKAQGIFVDLGPIDGFVKKEQVLDEELEILPDKRGYRSTESSKTIEIGDHVRARITQISRSMVPSVRGLRIGMTMRQPYLGKEEWVRR